MPNIAFLNGRFMPLTQAKISVEDRGFQFGDGVYELVRTYSGRLFHLDEHLCRMFHSIEALQLDPVYPMDRWKRTVEEARERSGYPDAKIYIEVTRGTAPRVHGFPKSARPTAVITVRRFEPIPAALRRNGAAVITISDIRWGRCNIKSVNLLPNVLARAQAQKEGAYEAVFLRDGFVMEGSGSNLFAVFEGMVVTPPPGPHILSGITREVVLDLASRNGFDISEKPLAENDLFRADELFLTGTTVEVLPVVKINGRAVREGLPGPVASALYRLFLESVRDH